MFWDRERAENDMVNSQSALTSMIALAVLLVAILLLWGHHVRSCWHRASKSGARVPGGSFGWPIVGETISFARNPDTYVASRIKRYGKVFKTSLFMAPAIVGTTADFAKLITTNSKVFVSGWPPNLKEVVGPKALMFQNGARHMSIKKILQRGILPDALRTKVTLVETIMLENMASWEQAGIIIGRDGTHKITMDTGIWLIFGVRDIQSTPEGKKASEWLDTVNKALRSIPLNLPGTPFNKGLKAKKKLTKYFEYLIQERQGRESTQEDMLGMLLAAKEDPQARDEVKDLDDETIVDNLLHYWFAAYETTSTTLTWILKYLAEYPDIFLRVQAEQQEILKSKGPSSPDVPRLTWEDLRSMEYTLKFFQEVQRIVTVVPVVMRMANQDVEYEGHLIPKGWRVCSLYKCFHLDAALFPDPTTFNPDRFDTTPKPYTYMPFSVGPHICPGMDIAKVISLIFIHHVTTTYTYESVEPDKGIEFSSFAAPRGGYPIHICRRS